MRAAFIGWLHQSVFNELWFQNFILVVTAIIAFVTLRSSSRHERRRATVDVVNDLQKDPIFIAARASLRALKDDSGKIDAPRILLPQDSPDQQAIFTVLNSYEFMATGLKTGAFDAETYKRMYYTNVVDAWTALEGFVRLYREKYKKLLGEEAMHDADTLYQDFEHLAEEWKRHPLSPHINASGLKWWNAYWAKVSAENYQR
jgi:hypothetical protein